jgi:hypothetical protein
MRTTLSAASVNGKLLIRSGRIETTVRSNRRQRCVDRGEDVCLNCTKEVCNGTRKCMMKRKAATI